MKVALYVRVSTDKQEAENQLLQLREFCKKNEWEIYKEYVDVISGKETSRPAFDQLFKDAHKKLFDVVVFWDLSRFSRAGVYHTIMKLRELDNLQIEWISYQEEYVRSLGPWSDVVISLLATIAKIEREKISERTKAGLERAKKNGKRLGRGYSIKQRDIDKIWDEYKIQGSINKTYRVLSYGKGTVHTIISNDIHTVEEYRQFLGQKKGGEKTPGKSGDSGGQSNARFLTDEDGE